MVSVAPKGRKHLSADALFDLIRSGFANIPDDRPNDTDISLTDALLSAFAMFSLKSPSLLAFEKARTESNLKTIYGIEGVPCDKLMREGLDHGVGHPSCLCARQKHLSTGGKGRSRTPVSF